MLIALEHVMSENNITYIRINAMSPERRAVNDRNFNATKQDELLTARTMMIAVDYKDGKSKGTEFSYMWKDAIDKKREGKTDEWTVEQKFIYDITSPNTAYDLYWGYKFFVQKRYYEASLHFHRAWSRMNKRYSLLEQWEIEKYNEVSFMLGESYLKMDLYPQAFFHFDGLAKEGNVEFTAELVKRSWQPTTTAPTTSRTKHEFLCEYSLTMPKKKKQKLMKVYIISTTLLSVATWCFL